MIFYYIKVATKAIFQRKENFSKEFGKNKVKEYMNPLNSFADGFSSTLLRL